VLPVIVKKNQICIQLALYPFGCHELAVPNSATLRQGPTHQGCSGDESLATCGRFYRIGIWIPYLSQQKQTCYYLYHLTGTMLIVDSIFDRGFSIFATETSCILQWHLTGRKCIDFESLPSCTMYYLLQSDLFAQVNKDKIVIIVGLIVSQY